MQHARSRLPLEHLAPNRHVNHVRWCAWNWHGFGTVTVTPLAKPGIGERGVISHLCSKMIQWKTTKQKHSLWKQRSKKEAPSRLNQDSCCRCFVEKYSWTNGGLQIICCAMYLPGISRGAEVWRVWYNACRVEVPGEYEEM